MTRFIQPTPTSPHDDLVEIFAARGVGRDAFALAKLAFAALDHAPLDAAAERVFEHVARELQGHAGAAPEVVLVLAVLLTLECEGRFAGWSPDPLMLARMTAVLADAFDDVSDALAVIFREKDGPARVKYSGLPPLLLRAGIVDPLRFMQPEAIRNERKHLGGNWNQPARERNPSLPDFWIKADPVRAIAGFEAMLAAEPINTLGDLAWGLERCLDLRYPALAEALYPLLAPLTQLLCRRRREEQAEGDRLLTRCCWAYGVLAHESAPAILVEDYKALYDLALSELGRMRGILREPEPTLSEDQRRYLDAAAFFALRTDPASLWDVLRRLLLAFRAVPRRSVTLDLRTWEEHDLEAPPLPWVWVPERISTVLELMLGRELTRDPELKELRRELAKYCIDRLKTRDSKRDKGAPITNEHMVEPSPAWRMGYIHAIKELHANVGEQGHRVLAWSQHNDPDEDVRAEAKAGQHVVRHEQGLPDDVSPRRPVFAAFWYLRQAHVIEVGGIVDEIGARRTLKKEIRRQATEQT